MRVSSIVLASLATVSAAGVAAAEPTSVTASATPDATYTVGVRIGGYGFRRETDAATTAWDECRMNGAGVFAQRSLRGHGPLFLEAGLDTYFSIGQGQPTDLPLDRQSALLTTAVGARTNVFSWLLAYVQIGGGLELTRLSVPYGDGSTIHANKAMPAGFIGFGAELKLAHGTYGGAMMRTLLMGNFNYDPQRLQMSNQWVAAPSSDDVFKASPAFATQGQFYVRKDL